jgi:hypothetical protein
MISGWPSWDEHTKMLETPWDPQRPFAAEEAWAKGQLAKGNKGALIYLLQCFLLNKEKPSPWLIEQLLEAIKKVSSLEVTSLDDVFGRPLKKGQRAEVIRREMKVAEAIYAQVRLRQMAGEAVDNEMFSRIGGQLKMSGSVVRGIYYKTRDWCTEFYPRQEDVEGDYSEEAELQRVLQKDSK